MCVWGSLLSSSSLAPRGEYELTFSRESARPNFAKELKAEMLQAGEAGRGRGRGRRQNVDQANSGGKRRTSRDHPLNPFTYHTTTYHVSHIQHGRRDSLHVFPPPNGPAAPGDRPPVHALLHQHIMSRRARGYAKAMSRKSINYTDQHSRPQPRRIAHCSRLIPSTQHQIAAPTQGVQSLPPHKLPQSRAPLPYPRRITPQAYRRETHPGRRRAIREAPLRAQSAVLCHQDSQQALAHLHFAQGRRKQARDSGEEG